MDLHINFYIVCFIFVLLCVISSQGSSPSIRKQQRIWISSIWWCYACFTEQLRMDSCKNLLNWVNMGYLLTWIGFLDALNAGFQLKIAQYYVCLQSINDDPKVCCQVTLHLFTLWILTEEKNLDQGQFKSNYCSKLI